MENTWIYQMQEYYRYVFDEPFRVVMIVVVDCRSGTGWVGETVAEGCEWVVPKADSDGASRAVLEDTAPGAKILRWGCDIPWRTAGFRCRREIFTCAQHFPALLLCALGILEWAVGYAEL